MAICTSCDTVKSVTHKSGIDHTFLDPKLKVKQKYSPTVFDITLFSHYSPFVDLLIKLYPNNGFVRCLWTILYSLIK